MSNPNCAQAFPFAVKLDKGDYYWCACGKSQIQPFCDGSHQGTEFIPVKFSVSEHKTYQLCGCKHSKNPPYCDGSHNKV